MALENTQRVSNLPVPPKDPKWKPPPKEVLQQPFQFASLSPRADGLNEYITALKDPSYRKVVDLLVDKYRDGTRKQIHSSSLSACFNALLWLTHTTILQAVAEGNIAQKYFNDKSTHLILDFLSHESAALRVRPGVYCNAIGNRINGDFLSTNEVCQVLDIMSIYIQGRDSALGCKLDNTINPKQGGGRLRYVTSSRASTQISKFIKAARRRCLGMGTNLHKDTPLPCSILEFGFGLDIEDRLLAHRNHERSNYIMNLFQACCEYLFPGKFILHQFVVFLCQSPEQASLAEVFFHLLGHGYTTNGAGFSHWPAGLSSVPTYRQSSLTWSDFSDWSLMNTPVLQNHKAFEEHMEMIRISTRDDIQRYTDLIASIEAKSREAASSKVQDALAAVEEFDEALDSLIEDLEAGIRALMEERKARNQSTGL